MNNYCLTCKYWDRSHENPDVGICELHDEKIIEAYRFQFEDCAQWLQGDTREPQFVQGTGMLVGENYMPNYKRIKEYYSRPFGNLPLDKSSELLQNDIVEVAGSFCF